MMAYIVLALALAFAISPVFSDFSGFDPNLYPIPQDNPPVQPAGWAFAIWGPIYLWLIVGAAFGALRRKDAANWQAYRPALAISLAVGTVWLAVATASPVWATVLIWIMLVAALIAFVGTPEGDVVFARAPVGLYAGWLTAASCVSLGLLAAGYGLLGPVPAAWAALLGALAIGTAVARARPSATYPAGIGWAALGIAAQNFGVIPFLTLLSGMGALAMAWLAFQGLRTTKAL